MDKQIVNIINKKKIPMEVLWKHIIPYTYNCQSKELLYDIKSYYSDLNLFKNIYYTEYNKNFNTFLLYVELLDYYEQDMTNNVLSMKFKGLLKRHIILKEIIDDEYKVILYLRKSYNRERYIKMIVGLMTPKERTDFFNKYVLVDDV
tara:strand:+ start:2811 stop:3251 length:441 start_codon:yes stop_codon:yes gene_type:complete